MYSLEFKTVSSTVKTSELLCALVCAAWYGHLCPDDHYSPRTVFNQTERIKVFLH